MSTPDAESLLWGRRPAPGRGRKPSLSVDGIVAEAIALADAEGLPGLSMPRLADKLGCGVMTLYRYIPGKDELVALMMDTCLGDPPAIPADGDWRSGCRAWALALRAVCHAHPWWIDITLHNRATGPNETAWLEAQLTALAPLGLDPVPTMNVALAISSYVRGAVQPELHPDPGPRFSFHEYPEARDRFPRVSAMFDSPDFQSGKALEDFFGFGLERLLAGLAELSPTEGDGSGTGV